MTATTQSTPHRNPWLVLAIICIPVFVGSLDLTVVSAFLPEVIVGLELPLQTTLDDAAWVLGGYLLAYTISLTFMGRVSDLVGRRATYVASLLLFIVGSIMVATAHQWPTDFLYSIYRRLGERPDIALVNLQALILGRVVQALGAGALVPVSLALVGDLFPPRKRARPLGLVGAIDTLGWVLGHLYGGLMVSFFAANRAEIAALVSGLGWPPPDWRTLFWINVPLTLLTIVLVLWFTRDLPEQRATGRFDFLGTAFIVGALVCLNVGLGANIEIASTTSSFEDLSPLPANAGPLVALAALFLAGFIFVEARVRDPLINLGMFRRRNLSAGSLVNLFVGFSLVIGLVSVPILVNVRLADASQLAEAALYVGVLLSALTVPMALAAIPGGWLVDRIGYRATTLGGLGLAILGFTLVWQTWHYEIADAIIALEMAIVGIGLGLTFAPISASVINAAHDDERGVASALVIILRLIGMSVSVSSLTTISLQRVNILVAEALGGTTVDPFMAVDTYARVTVQVLAELGLLGAVVCALALIPAALLRPDAPEPLARAQQTGEYSAIPGD